MACARGGPRDDSADPRGGTVRSPEVESTPPPGAPPVTPEDQDHLGARPAEAKTQSPEATPEEHESVRPRSRRREFEPPIKVLALGDSLTFGLGGDPGGYRAPLEQLLRREGIEVEFIGPHSDRDGGHHAGKIGRTANILRREVKEVLDDYSPDVVLLLIGTNDIRQPQNTVDQVARDIAEVAGVIRDRLPEVLLIVGSLPPVADSEIQERIDTINRLITARDGVLLEAAPEIHIADIAKHISLDDLDDGLHARQSGYVKMAHVWFETLRAAISH